MPGMVGRQVAYLDLEANEAGAVALPVALEPVGIGQPGRIIIRLGQNGGIKVGIRFLSRHGSPRRGETRVTTASFYPLTPDGSNDHSSSRGTARRRMNHG